LVSVLRWNGLQSFDDLAGAQELVIPTIVPPGLTPRQWRESQKDYPRRKPFSIGGASFEQPAAPPAPGRNLPLSPMTAAPSRPPGKTARLGGAGPSLASPPAAGPRCSSGRHAYHCRRHSRAAPSASSAWSTNCVKTGAGPWQASNKQGETLAGSDVKEQFQKQMAQQMWMKRTMSRPF
jgi:hypothetical protein